MISKSTQNTHLFFSVSEIDLTERSSSFTDEFVLTIIFLLFESTNPNNCHANRKYYRNTEFMILLLYFRAQYNIDFYCNQMWLQQIFHWSFFFSYLIQKSYKFHLKCKAKFKWIHCCVFGVIQNTSDFNRINELKKKKKKKYVLKIMKYRNTRRKYNGQKS